MTKQLIIIGCAGDSVSALTKDFVDLLLKHGCEVEHAGIRANGQTECFIGTAADAAGVDAKGMPQAATVNLSTLQLGIVSMDGKLDELKSLFKELLTGLAEEEKPKPARPSRAKNAQEKKEGGAVERAEERVIPKGDGVEQDPATAAESSPVEQEQAEPGVVDVPGAKTNEEGAEG